MQVRAGSRAMVRWERTAQKSESPPMPYAYAGRQKASGPSTREPLLRGSGQTDSLPKHRAIANTNTCQQRAPPPPQLVSTDHSADNRVANCVQRDPASQYSGQTGEP